MVKKQLEIERRKTCGPYCTSHFRLCSIFSVLFWLRKWYFLNFPPLCYRSSERAGASRLRSTHKKWVGGYFFSLSVGWQKNTLDFMGILRRREPSSPVLQALRWLCSINFGLPNHHTDLNKNSNLIGILMVLIMNYSLHN